MGTFIGKIIEKLFLEEKNINPLIKEEDDEEDQKENKNNSNVNSLELGFKMMDQLLNNDAFLNMTNEIAKNIDANQILSNIMKQPEFEQLNNTPEEIEKFKDKDQKINMEELYKYNLGKMGFNKSEQESASKNWAKVMNNPNFNKLQNDLQIQNNLNNNINNENTVKKSEDNNNINNENTVKKSGVNNNIFANLDFNDLLKGFGI